jgi:hypothetical protein
MNYELKDKINGCIAMEHAVASIYSAFVNMFPKEKEFWGELLNDETEHASFLIDTANLEDSVIPHTDIPPPSLPLIVKTLEFANNIKAQLKFGPLSLEEALKEALQLEESMVETYANELISDLLMDNVLQTAEFHKMLDSERKHVSRIRDMIMKKGYIRPS